MMTTARIAAVICAHNEQDTLPLVLEALQQQTQPLQQTIIVDDGSVDATREIVENFHAEVVQLPTHPESHAGTRQMAEKFNVGLSRVNPCAYILILGADDLLPNDYVERLVNRMEAEPRLVVASGQLIGDPSHPDVPRGGGRLIQTRFWQQISETRFPPLWCWEEYMVYKALQLGYATAGFPDVLFRRIRRQGRTLRKSVGDGKSMYALGYCWEYCLLRCLKLFLQSPKRSIGLFYGWLVAHLLRYKQADFAKFLKEHQRRKYIAFLGSKLHG
jgi:glycosyltransferase involved in cell wall biosynthesis